MAAIIDGKAISLQIKDELKEKAEAPASRLGDKDRRADEMKLSRRTRSVPI